MPIFLKEKPEDPASLGSSVSEISRLKKLAVALQDSIKQLTAKVRQLKSEKRVLEARAAQQEVELRRLKHELQRITARQKRNVEYSDFGD